MVSPGASSAKTAMSLSAVPGWRPAYAAAGVVGHLAERDEARPGHGLAGDGEGLVVRVDRGPLVAPPYAFAQPAVEHVARPTVLVRRVFRVRHANDVVRAERVEAVLGLGADLIVRRRDDRGEVARHVAGVSVAAKGLDLHVYARASGRTSREKLSGQTRAKSRVLHSPTGRAPGATMRPAARCAGRSPGGRRPIHGRLSPIHRGVAVGHGHGGLERAGDVRGGS